jgi:hypothetical protein
LESGSLDVCAISHAVALRLLQMAERLMLVTTLPNGVDAEMTVARLLDIGIHAISKRTTGSAEWGGSGACDVFVNGRDLERARELLSAEENAFSDEELARLSERAGREAEGG